MKRWFWLILYSFATASGAEVRLVDRAGRPELEVQATRRGVWTPLPGSNRSTVLNAEGDLRGDGYPSAASIDRRLAAVWLSPASQTITIVRADGSGSRTDTLAAPLATGTPLCLPYGDRWVVLYQVGGDDPHVMLAFVSWDAPEPLEQVRLGDGLLIDAASSSTGLTVVVSGAPRSPLRVYYTPIRPVPPPTQVIAISFAQPRNEGDANPQVCLDTVGDRTVVAVRVARDRAAILRMEGDDVDGPTLVRAGAASCSGLLGQTGH